MTAMMAKIVFNALAEFNTPRSVVISDIRVGLVDKALMAVVGMVRERWRHHQLAQHHQLTQHHQLAQHHQLTH